MLGLCFLHPAFTTNPFFLSFTMSASLSPFYLCNKGSRGVILLNCIAWGNSPTPGHRELEGPPEHNRVRTPGTSESTAANGKRMAGKLSKDKNWGIKAKRREKDCAKKGVDCLLRLGFGSWKERRPHLRSKQEAQARHSRTAFLSPSQTRGCSQLT